MWKNTSCTKYLILLNVRPAVFLYIYIFLHCNKSCSLQVGVSFPHLVRFSDDADLNANAHGQGWSAGEDVDTAWKVFKWDVKNINQPSHIRCRYMILAGYWLTIRMWEVSFCSFSWEMGFCISWGVVFFFSHGRKFRDCNVGPSNVFWSTVKYFVKYITMKFGIDVHGHQSNTSRSKLDLVQHFSL